MLFYDPVVLARAPLRSTTSTTESPKQIDSQSAHDRNQLHFSWTRDVAQVFETGKAMNAVLRALMQAMPAGRGSWYSRALRARAAKGRDAGFWQQRQIDQPPREEQKQQPATASKAKDVQELETRHEEIPRERDIILYWS